MAVLRLVCSHWAETLKDRPPTMHLEIENAPSHVLRHWIPSFPVQSLLVTALPDLDRLRLSDDDHSPESIPGIKADCMSPLTQSEALSTDFDQYIDLRMGLLHQLQFLSLSCPHAWRHNITFDATPLKSLKQLR